MASNLETLLANVLDKIPAGVTTKFTAFDADRIRLTTDHADFPLGVVKIESEDFEPHPGFDVTTTYRIQVDVYTIDWSNIGSTHFPIVEDVCEGILSGLRTTYPLWIRGREHENPRRPLWHSRLMFETTIVHSMENW